MQRIDPALQRKLRTFRLGKEPSELVLTDMNNGPKGLLDLASNDYLGLSRHPEIIKAAQEAIISEGIGAGGSRLITGSRPIHHELESELGSWLNRDRVLLFPSGFQANLAAVMSLADRNTLVFADRLIHNSLLVGIKASGAKLKRFAHNDLAHFKELLKAHSTQSRKTSPLVITESLFSMEGTTPPVQEIADICQKHQARLFVDEAHALGVLGEKGKGLCYGLDSPIEMISGTFGKAFGGGGAFLACNTQTAEDLLQNCGAFKYTTALAPPLAAAALAALRLIKANHHWGVDLQSRGQVLRSRIEEAGWPRPPGIGPILSVLIGPNQAALDLQQQLEDVGLLCVAIRPPTVPNGTARLRLVIHKGLPPEALNTLINTLAK